MKRGIIHLYKIGILFQDREFEHDIYEQIRAFYPGSEICSFYEEEEAGCDLYFRIEKQGDSCVIRYEDHENKGVTSAEFIEGQSSDALISCVDADDSEAKERAHAIRKERKDIVKIALYKLLVKLTGKTLPWGNLTGIRPAKLAMGLIESGMKNTEAAQEMRERYMVSPQKTALAITIANREREILKDIDYENGYSLYVGIPFCPSICLAESADLFGIQITIRHLHSDLFQIILFYINICIAFCLCQMQKLWLFQTFQIFKYTFDLVDHHTLRKFYDSVRSSFYTQDKSITRDLIS